MVAKVQSLRQSLSRDLDLAMQEASLYFERRGKVWTTFRKIAGYLADRQLAYVALEDLAMFHHGLRQHTDRVVLLVSPSAIPSLTREDKELAQTSDPQVLIDRETGVLVTFRLEGDPVAETCPGLRYPNPSEVADIADGLCFIRLTDFLNVKLGGWRFGGELRDLADVQELTRTLCLAQDLAPALHPDVRECFISVCKDVDAACKRFLLLWEQGDELSKAPTFDELVAANPNHAAELEAMRQDGMSVFEERPLYEGRAILFTSSRSVARKYGMHPESEYFFQDDP